MYTLITRVGWDGKETVREGLALSEALEKAAKFQRIAKIEGCSASIFHTQAMKAMKHGGTTYSARYEDGAWNDPTWHNWQKSGCPIPS